MKYFVFATVILKFSKLTQSKTTTKLTILITNDDYDGGHDDDNGDYNFIIVGG